MKDINVGDYVRTRWGCIAKFEGVHEGFYEFDNIIMDESSAVREELFVVILEKSSPNIIDLIEVGDYVNGECVISVDSIEVYTRDGMYLNEDIKSVVTKELFKKCEYRIEE